MKHINFLFLLSILFSCSSNNEVVTKKPEPGLFSKDASKGISITDFLNRGGFPGSPDDPRTPTGSRLIEGPDGQMYDENFIKTIPGGFNNMQEIERRRKIFEGMP